jgi:hypothetical protein
LDVSTLQRLARGWSENTNAAPIAFNGEGSGLYNLWIGDDWRTQEVDRFEDFSKLFMSVPNTQMLEGYRFEEGMKTAFSRFLIESRFNLPRFAVDEATGGIVMVQDMVGIDAEVGSEYIRNPDWMEAPFRLAVSPTRDQATILTRPPLAVHGNGAPIPVIPAFGGWKIKNEYDKVCNPDRLLPHWESWNEVGYRPKNPDGSLAIMYRARTFLNAPQNFCDLAPVFEVETPAACDNFTNIGCENKRVMQNSVTALSVGQYDIRCSAVSCGDANTYRIKMERLEPLNAGSQAIPCECGSDITVLIADDEGVVREQQAVLINTDWGYPYGEYYIQFAAPLTAGDCIRAVRCNDSTPDFGLVTNCLQVGTGVVKYALDSALVGATVGTDVFVRFRNSAGTSLGTISGEITVANAALYHYTVTGVGLVCEPTTVWAGDIDYTKTTLEID